MKLSGEKIIMSTSIRSFIAFDINNDSLLKKISDAQNLLIETGADLKLVEPRNIHVTIRFLGNITLSMADKIHEKMKKIIFSPFTINIHGVGAFPTLKYPRVIWAGIKQGNNELRNIFDQLEPELQNLGFPPDPKGFNPHITIARVKTGRNKAELIKKIQLLADYNFGVVKAECLRLKKSVLTPQGPIYSTLREICASRSFP